MNALNMIDWIERVDPADTNLIQRAVNEQIASAGGFKQPDGTPLQSTLEQMRVSDLKALRRRLVVERQRLQDLDAGIAHLLSRSSQAI